MTQRKAVSVNHREANIKTNCASLAIARVPILPQRNFDAILESVSPLNFCQSKRWCWANDLSLNDAGSLVSMVTFDWSANMELGV